MSNTAGHTIMKAVEQVFGSYSLFREVTLFMDYSIFFNGTYLQVTKYNISNVFPNPAFTYSPVVLSVTSLGQVLRVIVST